MSAHVQTMIGPYAVDALPARERDRVEDHLRGCSTCAAEARELVATAALLGVAAAAPVPAGLRAAVMAETARTRQDRPPLSFRATQRVGTGVLRQSLAAAACLALVSFGLLGYAEHVRGDLGDLRARDRDIAAVRTASDAVTVTATSAGTTGTVTLSRHAARMVFLAGDLAPLPARRTYQLWLVGPDGVRSAGTLMPAKKAPTGRLLSLPADVEQLMLTNEPAPGSTRPTTAPTLRLNLAAT